MTRELVCINCPRGCRLTADELPDGKFAITGNRCPRGEAYAIQEMTDPRRTVTAVVKTDFPDYPYLPVRTNAPFPKAKIASLLNHLYKIRISNPVQPGDSILENIDGTGIDIIACASILDKII